MQPYVNAVHLQVAHLAKLEKLKSYTCSLGISVHLNTSSSTEGEPEMAEGPLMSESSNKGMPNSLFNDVALIICR